MDETIAELEAAASINQKADFDHERKIAEEKLLQLRNQSEPYELCLAILDRSSNEYLLYEAGRCLSNAVVREWNKVFASSAEDPGSSRAVQLMTFLLNWASCRGRNVESWVKKGVLQAIGALAKRAAAAHAEKVVVTWRSSVPNSSGDTGRLSTRRSRILTHPPDDPGPPCPFLISLIQHLEALIQPVLTEMEHSALDDCLLGLNILLAFLDELSNSHTSVNLEMPLEAHIFLRARFQDFELVRIFHTILCVLDRAVDQWGSTSIFTLSKEKYDIMFRLVSCLECITSWDFLPRELVGFYVVRHSQCGNDTLFRPSLRWASIFGPDSLPATLLLLIKLHTWIRECPKLGSISLSCLVRISSMSGPLTDPVTPLTGLTEPDSNGALSAEDNNQVPSSMCSFHILTFMNHLSSWFYMESNELTSGISLLMALPGHVQAELRQDCDERLTNTQAVPRICPSQLQPYELPLLSELVQNIVLSHLRAWEPVETALALPVSVAAGQRCATDVSTICHHALVSLVILDRFYTHVSELLLQCLRFTGMWPNHLKDHGRFVYEAVERLFNSWTDLIRSIPSSGVDLKLEDDWLKKPFLFISGTPVALTTSDSQEVEQNVQQIACMVQFLRSRAEVHQRNLFQTFILSKLSPDVGFRQPYMDTEDLDSSVNESDDTAWEDSLFSVGACGLANAKESCNLLCRLIDERIDKIWQYECPSRMVIELMEDLHWLLLVTGHFLVSGPAQLHSVLRSGSTWSTEFSLPQVLLNMGVDESVDISCSRELLRLAVTGRCTNCAEEWPPSTVMLDNVPPLIRLISSTIRLLWLQITNSLDSAQLPADNLWLTTRFALAYLCYNVLDRDAVLVNKSRSPILIILHDEACEPQPAHQSSNRIRVQTPSLSNKENMTEVGQADLTRNCIQGLLTCAHLALKRWNLNGQVATAAITMISVLSRISPNPSNLVCPAWYDICSIICGSDEISQHLIRDELINLVQACLCGSWAIDTVHDSEPLLLQLLQSLRDRLLHTITLFDEESQRGSLIAATLDNEVTNRIVNSLTILCGIARAIGSLATLSESATDLISHVWTGILLPALNSSAHVLILRCHTSSDVIQALFQLFSEVADSCLIYLANIPSAQPDNPNPTETEPNPINGSVASSVFLNLTVALCKNYAKQNVGKTVCKYIDEEEREAELNMLLTLLSRVLAHEFELRLTVCTEKPRGHPLNNALNATGAVDIVVVGLGFILPMITTATLMVPELCRSFFSLASYTCELCLEGLAHLNGSQLVHFGKLIRVGIFGSVSDYPSLSTDACINVDNSVTLQCLEIIIALADYTLTARARQAQTNEFQIACYLSSNLGLDTRLLADLFTLVTKDAYSVDLEAAFSTAILDLIHLDRDAYAQLVHQWLKDCGPERSITYQRLRDAFERLGTPVKSDATHSAKRDEQNPFTQGFLETKPSRIARLDFQQRFHTFVAEVRAFACRC